MNPNTTHDVAVIGAGLGGIATAYFLKHQCPQLDVVVIDERQPMSYTSAQSGDNYRNWWPHPVMRAFTDDSITLVEQLARDSENAIALKRRGYLLATRRTSADDLVAALHAGYADPSLVREHGEAAGGYRPPGADWTAEPDGVDVLSGRFLLERHFPMLSRDIRHVLHVRRAGDFSGQQLGQLLLERFRELGGQRRRARVDRIEKAGGFALQLSGGDAVETILVDRVVLAAGPMVGKLASPLDIDLPIANTYQQKVAFEDVKGAVSRTMPFAIDLDAANFAWTDDEAAFLAEDPGTRWLTGDLPGGLHCRPEGSGRWVKMGWAWNREHSEPAAELLEDPRRLDLFPELLIRAGSRFLPALAPYREDMPRRYSHYGGYYTMTAENWPLIGPTPVDGVFLVAALSGFGTMAACGAGRLCATWMSEGELPAYADALSLGRYRNESLMAALRGAPRGVL